MPAIPTDNVIYLKRIRDLLRSGVNYSTASLIVGSTTSRVQLIAQEPGVTGNNISVAFTVPAGTSGLTVSVVGNAITVALAVSGGVVVGGSNTATLIAAAINGSAAASALVLAVLPTGSGAGSISVASTANLSGGRGGADAIATLPSNFIKAQDVASVLEVLMDSLNSVATLTVVSGTTSSLTDTGAFVANSQIGNTVTFTGNVTAALAGKTAVVLSNTANILTFTGPVIGSAGTAVASAAGDTYTIRGTMANSAINVLRNGRGRGDAAATSLYADSRITTDVLIRIVQQLGGTLAPEQILFSGVTVGASSAALVTRRSYNTTVRLNTKGSSFRIDAFKNMKFTAGAQVSKIVSNTENTLTVAGNLTTIADGASISITMPENTADASRNYTATAGGQMRDNRILAELIRAAQAAVTAFTLPT